MWHMYKYVLKHPFRQDGHDRLNMEQKIPYFTWTIFHAT